MRVMPKQNAIEQSMRTCTRMGFGGGLYLIRGKTDGHHYWRVDFSFNGKRNTLSIGVFPGVSPDKARQQADAQIALARSGGDPSVLRKEAKNRDMNQPGENALHKFEILHPESFQAQSKLWLAHVALGWKENTLSPTLRRLELHLYPALGHKLISEIRASDVATIVTAISASKKRDTAQRVWEIGRRICEFALVFKHPESNPFELVRSLLPKRRTNHFAAITHPTKLADLLVKIYSYHGTLRARCALKLLTMLHVRPGNLRQAMWCDFDLVNGWWQIPSDEMKDSRHDKPNNQPHVVPLSTQAVEILWGLHQETGHLGKLFPSRHDPNGFMSENTMNKALRIMGFSTTKEITGHGFRAVARTLARQELGFDAALLELQLDHTVRDSEGKPYDRSAMIKDRKKMMQAWADYLDELRLGRIVYLDPLANFTPVTSMSRKPSESGNVIDIANHHEFGKSNSQNFFIEKSTASDWDDLDPMGWENVISINHRQFDVLPASVTSR